MNRAVYTQQINTTIHPKDQMFRGDLNRYFDVGFNALARIKTILAIYETKPKRILDLGCGCGRVTRHLRHAYGDSDLVASDVMPHAVEFCAENFGATAHLSSIDLENVEFAEGFDLIWSGSLMTHLNEEKAAQMFNLIVRSLKIDGVAIWTTHGRYVETLFQSGNWPYIISPKSFELIVEDYRKERYGYTDYDHMKGYGISLTPLRWIWEKLTENANIRLISFIERGWDEHQDIFAIIKKPIA